MKPPKRLTDPTFVYVPSNNTDIRKTFARIRKEMNLPEPRPGVVVSIAGKNRGKG